MGFKHSIWGRFFGSKTAETRDKIYSEPLTQERKAEQVVTAPPPPPAAEVELKLPHEHALHTLCDMRVQRAGGMSRPRLRLEGREDFSDDELHKELGRLQRAVTLAANSRLKEVRTQEAKAAASAEKDSSAEQDALSQEKQEKQEEPAVQNDPPIELDALPIVHIAADKLSAWLMVFPPVGAGKELNQELLSSALKKSGIAFGVDEELLKSLPELQERYFSLFPVAKGTPALQGKDGYVIEHYDRVVERKFEVDEHDRVDYASLKFFQSVEKGDVICEAVLPVPGNPGRTVLNQEIPVKDGRAAPLNKGRNTEISEDGTRLLASMAGHVEYTGNGFHVKSVLEIAENVDYSTGNINYMGDVHIHGSVCSGFSVRAAGNVTIDGVVEAGSVDAGGDLIVARGIVGNSQSVVRAQHNVYAKYLENSIVHAGENLQADCIVNSDVYSDGEIQVCSGRGIIVGGRIRAAKKISAKVVGSKSESQTSIFLGGEPCVEYEREKLAQLIEKSEKELEKLEKRPDSPDKMERINRLRFDLSVNRIKLEQMDEEMAKKQAEVQSQGGCRLICDHAYPGLMLTICNVFTRLQHETSKCDARLFDGEILFL